MRASTRPLVFRILLIGPAALAICIFMVIPLMLMAWISIQGRDYSGGVIWGQFSFDAYTRLFFER